MREVFLAEAVKIGLKHCYACAVNSSLNVVFKYIKTPAA